MAGKCVCGQVMWSLICSRPVCEEAGIGPGEILVPQETKEQESADAPSTKADGADAAANKPKLAIPNALEE